MTVQQLIEKLQLLPPDAHITLEALDDDDDYDLHAADPHILADGTVYVGPAYTPVVTARPKAKVRKPLSPEEVIQARLDKTNFKDLWEFHDKNEAAKSTK